MLIVHFKRTLERIHYTIKVIEIFLNLICMFFTLFLISSFLLMGVIIIEEKEKRIFYKQ
jgi:hypothetical protein